MHAILLVGVACLIAGCGVAAVEKTTRSSSAASNEQGVPNKKVRPAPGPPVRTERQIVNFAELPFADEALKTKTRFFHQLAEEIAEEDWFVNPYRDNRWSQQPVYAASWRTMEKQPSSFRRSVLPFRSIGIRLEGQHVDGVDSLQTLTVDGLWVPLTGWAAVVRYHSDGALEATAAKVDPTLFSFRFDRHANNLVIQLSRPSASASAWEGRQLRYDYRVGLPWEHTTEHRGQLKVRIHALHDSPEKMRDTLLDDLERLRRKAKHETAQGIGIQGKNYSNVRSDNPPRPLLAGPNGLLEHQPSPATRRELLDGVVAELDQQERAIREEFQQIHTALVKALPIKPTEFPWREVGMKNKH